MRCLCDKFVWQKETGLFLTDKTSQLQGQLDGHPMKSAPSPVSPILEDSNSSTAPGFGDGPPQTLEEVTKKVCLFQIETAHDMLHTGGSTLGNEANSIAAEGLRAHSVLLRCQTTKGERQN